MPNSITVQAKYLLLVFLLCVSSFVFSQEQKPKIALVLSGGGAKGVAHVPVLQKLDSLGIVPDLIVGTSMGSVIGGLYAAGYSGDSIAQLIKNANWDKLLGGNVSLNDVGVSEKSEFDRYLVSFDLIKGKPKVKSSLLNDQNLREYLSSLLYPVYNITNFDDLPIPFRAVTTDIVNGKEVLISEESLVLAIRASMSIPGVFEPVNYKNTLLVDGGILNNFPTDVAKSLGADIIIGSDVGGGLEPIEKLDNMATIMFQTSMLTSNLRLPENRALCDILIDHYPNLTYSTQDFNEASSIYNEGVIATNQSLSALDNLAERLKNFEQAKHELPKTKNSFEFHKIEYKNISPQNLSLVKARMNLLPNTTYSTEEIIKAIDRAIGTELFFQITYSLDLNPEGNTLVLTGFEKAANQISGALHYDTNQGVGLVLNYTGRNILGYSSRLLLGLDVAEQPKFRVQYQQHVGELKKWWWRTQIFGEKIRQSFYSFGNKGDELKRTYFKTNLQINRDLNSLTNFVGLDLNYEYTKIKPKLNPSVNNNVYDLRRYSFKNLEVSAYFSHNSFNRVFFPTHGALINARVSHSLFHYANIEFDEFFENNDSGATNGFSKVSIEYEKRLPIKKSMSIILAVNSGLTFIEEENANDLSFINYGPGAQYYLGGNLTPNRRDSYVFNGLKDAELIVTQFVNAQVAFQIEALRNIFITPYANFASVGFGNVDDYFETIFSAEGDWINTNETSLLFSAGTTFSYNSILGPVNFDVAYLNNENNLQLFFSVGLNLSIP